LPLQSKYCRDRQPERLIVAMELFWHTMAVTAESWMSKETRSLSRQSTVVRSGVSDRSSTPFNLLSTHDTDDTFAWSST